MSESFFFFFFDTALHWEHIEHFIQNPHSEKLSKPVIPILVITDTLCLMSGLWT